MLTLVVKTTRVIVTSTMSGTIVFLAFTGDCAQVQLLRASLLFTSFLSHLILLYAIKNRHGSLNFLRYSQMSNLNPHAQSWKPSGLNANAREWTPTSTRLRRKNKNYLKSLRKYNASSSAQMNQYIRNINRFRNSNNSNGNSRRRNRNKNNRTRRYR
jgi:hypothetical protein